MTLTKLTQLKLLVGVLFIVAIGFLVFSVKNAEANPPSFIVTASTASATTSPVYQTPGTATSSLSYDAYQYQGTADVNGNMYFTVEMQYTASSSATSKLGMSIERSTDGIDYYADNVFNSKSFDATTTPSVDISSANTLSWTFASTSQASGAVLATNNRALKTIRVPVLSRYTRVNFYQSGTTNGAIWADILATKNKF